MLLTDQSKQRTLWSPWSGLHLFFVLCALSATPVFSQDATGIFLKRHWSFPLPAQGQAPEQFSSLEASLDPGSCGTCHIKQLQDWQTSLHAHAMGPGVMGQLLAIRPDATEALRACTRCHAPLAEQEAALKKQLREKPQNALHEQGLVCAACHVRKHTRYGPPATKPSANTGPHGGFVSNSAFEDSRFCATCHQFNADGLSLNDKPLENTYAEWLASSAPKQGKQCQNCHMPERRHLWRGIHDAEMTRQGVSIESTPPSLRDGKISAQIVLTNSGTGHYFPTYVTPRVLLRIYQVSTDEKMIAATLQEKIIGRTVSADISKELADTRIAPGKSITLNYSAIRHPQAQALVYQVTVEPDYFYSGVFRSILEEHPANKEVDLIRKALINSQNSAYDLFIQRHGLN